MRLAESRLPGRFEAFTRKVGIWIGRWKQPALGRKTGLDAVAEHIAQPSLNNPVVEPDGAAVAILPGQASFARPEQGAVAVHDALDSGELLAGQGFEMVAPSVSWPCVCAVTSEPIPPRSKLSSAGAFRCPRRSGMTRAMSSSSGPIALPTRSATALTATLPCSVV